MNTIIADRLVAEANERSGYGASALLNSANIIRNFATEITDVQQLQGVRGIGEGTLRRVQAILSGDVTSSSPITTRYDFTQLKFFGRVFQRQLYESGITSLQQLLTAVEEHRVSLTASQRLGLQYRDELAQRIPRAEVAAIGQKVIAACVAEGMRAELVGSYRRGKEDSGDVDVLITGDTNWIHRVVTRLQRDGLIKHIFSLGEVKLMAIAVGTSGVARSLDIRYVPPECWGSALLFATGPDKFNVFQRQVAIDKGWKLSEYGLFNAAGELLPSATELELFHQLALPYLSPVERDAAT